MEGYLKPFTHIPSKTTVVLLILLSHASRLEGLELWSKWFDEMPTLSGDNQSLARIKEAYGYYCPLKDVVEVECRVTGSFETFRQMTWYQGNHLSPPCNQLGVACSEFDQILQFPAMPCRNYEIRFRCYTRDTTTTNTELQNPLSVHGGFIALAAGLSVVVPLVCVLIVQVRRAKREERARAAQAANAGDGNESNAEGLAEPPPTYEQLFGPEYEPQITVMHSRYNSTDVLIEEDENVSHGISNRAALGSESDGGNESGEGGGNISSSPTVAVSVATISGNGVTDSSVSQQGSEMISNSRVVSLDVNNLGSSQSNNGRNNPRMTTTHILSSTSTSVLGPPPPFTSTRPPPFTSSRPPPPFPSTPPPRPPPLQCTVRPPPPPPPPSSTSTEPVNQTNSLSSTTPSPVTPSNRGSRFPGMHISLQDFFSVLRNQSDRELPPPSYEEALKILEKAEKAKKEGMK